LSVELTIGQTYLRFTDRHGGVSVAPYDSANLGAHVGDDAASVRENRRRLASDARWGTEEPGDWVWLDQVHGDAVLVVDHVARDVRAATPRADAAVTTRSGVPLVVVAADCAPIALVGDRASGVVHAGWRGLEAGVIERAVRALRVAEADDGGDAHVPVRAVLGPCIHPGRYEFTAADLARLVTRFGPSVAGTTIWGTPAFDLPAAVRVGLAEAGVVDVVDLDVCTAASTDHFSHRRDGVTGRQAVILVRTP
jgi:YfiH family protein